MAPAHDGDRRLPRRSLGRAHRARTARGGERPGGEHLQLDRVDARVRHVRPARGPHRHGGAGGLTDRAQPERLDGDRRPGGGPRARPGRPCAPAPLGALGRHGARGRSHVRGPRGGGPGGACTSYARNRSRDDVSCDGGALPHRGVEHRTRRGRLGKHPALRDSARRGDPRPWVRGNRSDGRRGVARHTQPDRRTGARLARDRPRLRS